MIIENIIIANSDLGLAITGLGHTMEGTSADISGDFPLKEEK